MECIKDTGIAEEGDMKCTPMIGSMTFYSDCATCPYPEEEILSNIKKAFDENLFVDGDLVKQVNYIGSRKTVSARSSSLGTGMSIGFVGAALATTMAVVYSRRRKRNRELVESSVSGKEIGDDLARELDLNETQDTVNLSDLLTVCEEEDEDVNGINVSLRSNTMIPSFIW